MPTLLNTVDSLLRLRQEIAKLIVRHTTQATDALAKARQQSRLYEILLQGLSVSRNLF